MNWSNIKLKNADYFDENPVSELVLAGIFESKFHSRNHGHLRYIAGLGILAIKSILSGFINNKKYYPNVKGIVTASLDRPNDWGIKYPIVKHLDAQGVCLLFLVSSACKNNHEKELSKLENAIVQDRKQFNKINFFSIHFSDLYCVLKHTSKDFRIINEEKIGNIFQYFYTYLSMRARARTIGKFCISAKFSFTLGERIFGLVQHMYGVKHFVIQHGHMTASSATTWPNYTSANNYRSILFGDHYVSDISKIYPHTIFCALGNPYYDDFSKLNNDRKKNIVFFSVTHAFINSGYTKKRHIRKNKKYIVYNTLEELVDLHNKVGSIYSIKVKLHPNENPDVYLQYNSLFGNEIEIIDGNVDSFEVLQKACIAISWSSTTNLEAVICNSLSIQLLPENGLFSPQEFSYVIHSLKELLPIIESDKKISSLKKEQRKIVNEKYISNFGCATETIGEYIIKEALSG